MTSKIFISIQVCLYLLGVICFLLFFLNQETGKLRNVNLKSKV